MASAGSRFEPVTCLDAVRCGVIQEGECNGDGGGGRDMPGMQILVHLFACARRRGFCGYLLVVP